MPWILAGKMKSNKVFTFNIPVIFGYELCTIYEVKENNRLIKLRKRIRDGWVRNIQINN